MSWITTAIADTTIGAGVPVKLAASGTGGARHIAIANTTTDRVFGVNRVAVAAGDLARVSTGGRVKIYVGATVVADLGLITEGGAGAFGVGGSKVFGTYQGTADVNGLVWAWLEDKADIAT